MPSKGWTRFFCPKGAPKKNLPRPAGFAYSYRMKKATRLSDADKKHLRRILKKVRNMRGKKKTGGTSKSGKQFRGRRIASGLGFIGSTGPVRVSVPTNFLR